MLKDSANSHKMAKKLIDTRNLQTNPELIKQHALTLIAAIIGNDDESSIRFNILIGDISDANALQDLGKAVRSCTAEKMKKVIQDWQEAQKNK